MGISTPCREYFYFDNSADVISDPGCPDFYPAEVSFVSLDSHAVVVRP